MDGIFVDCDRYVWLLGRRRLPSGITMNGGSDWMVLPHEFVDYLVHTKDDVVEKIRRFYRYTLLPVEVCPFKAHF